VFQGRVLAPRPFFFLGTTVASRGAPECFWLPSPPAVLVVAGSLSCEDKNDAVRLAATALPWTIPAILARLSLRACFLPYLEAVPFRKLRDAVIRRAPSSCRGIYLAQQPRRYIPVLPGIGDNGDGLLVMTSQDSEHYRAASGMETHSFTYAETQHRGVRARLMKEPESSHNLVVQRRKFFFGKRINIDLAHCWWSGFAPGFSLYYSCPLLLSHRCGTMNMCE
jgi:hypothetical protein